MALRQLPWWARLSADALDGLRLLAEAAMLYRRSWRPLLLLVAMLLLPVTAAKSCMVAAVMGSAAPSPLVDGSAGDGRFLASQAGTVPSGGGQPCAREDRQGSIGRAGGARDRCRPQVRSAPEPLWTCPVRWLWSRAG